jgi:hypothetical protein
MTSTTGVPRVSGNVKPGSHAGSAAALTAGVEGRADDEEDDDEDDEDDDDDDERGTGGGGGGGGRS